MAQRGPQACSCVSYLENGRSLEMVQNGCLWTVDLRDESFGMDMVVLVRVDRMQLGAEVLEREEADVRDRFAEVGVPGSCDAKATSPVVDETGRGRLHDVRTHCGTEHRQVKMRLLDPVVLVVLTAKLVVNLNTSSIAATKRVCRPIS